jgi:signal transduction histidine kinase
MRGRAVTHGLGVRHAALWSVSPGGGPRLDVEHAEGDESLLGAHAWDAAVAAVIASGRANAGAGHEAPPHAEAAGAWALQPLSAHGRVLGVLAAWDAGESGRSVWESGDLECLAALADQHALLLEHARRLEGAQTADRRVEELVSRLRAQDRVVALGELAGRVSAEALPALLAMRDALTRALAGEGDDEARRALLEGVDAELERVAALLGEQDAYARLDRPRLRMEQLNGVLVTALQEAAEPLARRRVRLVKRLAPDLPELLLDAARIRRVVANLLACALESLPTGGRVRVETRRAGAFVVLELTHDRIEQTGDALEQLFASFSGSAGSGAAVGLGLAHQIVREHGGEIRVRRDEEWTSTLAVTFPVLGNQDRRVRSDRRAGGADRRSRGPGG